jgi:signal transduction histidine kinase/CheY-like chemotaxis protein
VSLLSRLFLLVTLALLPAIAIQAYNEVDMRRERQHEVREQALGLAQLAAAEQQQIILGIRQVLIALSELPAIKEKDGPACDAYLSAIKRKYPAFVTFLAADLTGRSFCDANEGYHTVTLAGRAYFAKALNTGAFTVGEFSVGISAGRNVIPFAMPFYDEDGREGGLIVASLSLDWLADELARKEIPRGDALAIADRNGRYLARYPENARFVGREMPEAEHRSVAGSGTIDVRDLDGVERITGYATLSSDSGALLVSVGLNKAQAFTAIAHRTERGVLLIILGTSLVLGLSWMGARRFIDRPLGQLVEVANRWRRGDYAHRAHIRDRRSDIARVGDAFNAMADTLEVRERGLREAKDAAEAAAAQIRTVFESTTDGVVIIDRDWRVGDVNERARTELAAGRDLVGTSLWAAFPDWVGTEADECLRTAMSEQHPVQFEMFLSQRDTWHEVNAFPFSQGLAVYCRDVTEHKRALAERRLMEEQLHQSQKMEAVGQLTGGIAHDFNNLLAVVIGNLELIEGHAGDNEDIKDLVEAARRTADRGAKLTGQLLAFSRRQTLEPKVVFADRLIRDFHDLIRRAVGDGCEIELIGQEGLWACHVDPAQLESALLNLALNGRDAMPSGGRLRIEARNAMLDGGQVSGLAPGPYVSLSVRDTGSGMSAGTLSRVFEPFFTTKDVGKGTGLGLSMVYGFARQSGGHVAIQSAVGVGTTVTLYLPKAELPSPAGTEAEDKTSIPTGSARVLVVDDNEALLRVTATMLAKLGYQVVAAQSAGEALGILKREGRFDLLLSDIGLPDGMSGIELAREAERCASGIKVLLTTGYTDTTLRQHQATGGFAMIAKPYYQADLARALWSVLHEG